MWGADLVALGLLVAAPLGAAEVSVSWILVGSGTGPGVVTRVARAVRRTTAFAGPCHHCQVLRPEFPYCVGEEGHNAVSFGPVAAAPDGGPNVIVDAQVMGKAYRLTGETFWGGAGGGAVLGFEPDCAGGTSCTVAFTIAPRPAAFAGLGVQYLPSCGNACTFCGTLHPTLPTCCGGNEQNQVNVTVSYAAATATAPFSCAREGTSRVEADGLWHLVVDAAATSCTAPNGDTRWSAQVYGLPAGAWAEGVMTGTPTDPGAGLGGRYLLVRAVLPSCPPNCPPPSACVADPGACPPGCPPYCPPPAGCPEDPGKCPPAPGCPPYCPPPAGCPADPSLCPPGCPPICPPPPGCPEDPGKCPAPPGCPPNCAPECPEAAGT